MRHYFLILVLLLPQICLAEKNYNVVFHINDASRLSHLNSSIRNLKTSLKDRVHIVAIFNGRAVTRLTDFSGTQKIIDEMLNNGAELHACSNALSKNEISKEHLIKGVTFLAEGGLVKLVTLQEQGYIYIKP